MTMNDIQRNAQALVAAPEPDGCIAAQTYMSSSLLPLTMSTAQAAPFMFKAPPMQPVLRMYNQGGEYGTLRFDENGMFQFEGDASASAQVLFAEMKRLSGK
jgi:hypothetical protein